MNEAPLYLTIDPCSISVMKKQARMARQRDFRIFHFARARASLATHPHL
jgi:hypothetical protein